jgi:hypothetical protein
MDDGLASTSSTPTFRYVALYDEQGVKQAERAWYAKSLLTSRAATTFAVPGLALFMIVLLKLLPLGMQRFGMVPGSDWIGLFYAMRIVFTVLMALSFASTLFFYLVRPLGSWTAIRKSPRRTVKADAAGVEIDTGARTGRVTWDKILHVWQTERYLMLVIGKYVQIPLPKQGMPAGMEEFIRLSAFKA